MPKRVSKSLNPYVDRRDGSKQSALTSTRQPSRLITFHFTPTIAYNDICNPLYTCAIRYYLRIATQ